jgi:hypothetical protein
MGYESEPYLRIGADGTVEENVNSKATYLNRTLTGTVHIPPTAGPTATPDWRRVGGGGTYAWHDHRVHWMASGVPPEEQTWTVPLLVNGAPASIDGWYAAVSAQRPPWWLVTLAVGRRRPRRLVRAPACHRRRVVMPPPWDCRWPAVGRLPASGVGDWAGVVLLAVAWSPPWWRRRPSRAWLAAPAWPCCVGRSRLSVLDRAVLVTSLPAWLDRLAWR